MREFDMVPMSTVVEEYVDRGGQSDDLARSRLMKFASDVLSKIYPRAKLEHRVALLNVQEHRVRVPDNFDSIIHVAFRPGAALQRVGRWEVISWVNRLPGACDMKIELQCQRCGDTDGCTCSPDIVIDATELWRRQHPEFYTGSMLDMRTRWASTTNPKGGYRSPYDPRFYLLRPAQNYMFNADYHVGGCLNLDPRVGAAAPYEYTFDNPYFRLNSRDGQMLLSYYGKQVGPDGYPMVPNVTEAFEAMTAYMEAAELRRIWRRNPKDRNLYNMVLSEEARADTKIARAEELLNEVPFNEFWAFSENHWMKVAPYYEFHSDFNATQPDKYRVAERRLRMDI